MDLQKEIGWLLKEKYGGNLPAGRQGQEKFYKDIERLNAGEPVSYVIGFIEFLGCKIDLSKKPLIPRIETEYWVGEAIKEIKVGRVLDLFAGSGCIGIAISRHVKNAKVTFADKYKKAIEQIKINLKINNIDRKRARVIQSDMFNEQARQKREAHFDGPVTISPKASLVGYDYIFSNPPYIPKTRKAKLPKSVINFEPAQALFGGNDGLYFIKKFLSQAKEYLNKNGKIFMEFDSQQKKEIEKMIKKFGYKNFEFHRDQFGKWRWVAIS